jgi:hypothetical protein
MCEVAEAAIVDPEAKLPFDKELRSFSSDVVLEFLPSLVKVTHDNSDNHHGTSSEKSDKEGDTFDNNSASHHCCMISLAHFSVKEYLMSEKIRASECNLYSMEEIPSHVSLAKMCFAYLQEVKNKSSLNLETFAEFPLTRYASEHLTTHIRHNEKNTEVIVEIMFEPKNDLLVWIHICDTGSREPSLEKIEQPLATPI